MTESAGARLKKIRLEKGLTLEEAHKKTKIHPDILRSLEEDSYINLSPVYVKGFLRIYCKFLGLDPKDFIPDYREPEGKFRPVSDEGGGRGAAFKTFSERLSFLKAVDIKTVIVAVITIVVALALFNLGKKVSSSRKTVASKVSVTSAKSVEKEPIANKAAANVPQQPKSPAVTSIRLGIRAKENCWVQLKADGKVVYQGILKKGRFENWQAKGKFELSLGNAGVVELEVNGKLITNLGRRGQVLKNILITKDGLDIKR